MVEHVKSYNFSIKRLHWHEYAAQTNSQLSVLISKDKITKITKDTSVVKKENEVKKMKI